VRAGAYEKLATFASGVVTGTSDPRLLATMINDLEAAAGAAPAGKERWRVQTYLADALTHAGRPDEALALYAHAAAEAETAEYWADAGWICHGWANALVNVGQFELARATFLRSAEFTRRTDRPRAVVLGSELEALRMCVKMGGANQVLALIEMHLDEVQEWWRRRQAGEHVDMESDESLARLLVSNLDIAHEAHRTLENWQASLDLLEEIETVQRMLGAGEHDRMRTAFNKYGPLVALGRLAEAKLVAEGCLNAFHRAGDILREAKAVSALAEIWNELGDVHQAVAVERQALAARERLTNPVDRAGSHQNLSNYLHRAGHIPEAHDHQLAALAYRLACRLDLSIPIRNLAGRIRKAIERGESFELPRLADLVAKPAFASLRIFLTSNNLSIDSLQVSIDECIEQVRTLVDMADPT
jgi:tetratricopeptide (TPR) repeat protein